MLIIPFQLQTALRGLRIRPWRTLLTLLGVTLGVAVVLAIQVTNQSTMASLERIFNRATGQTELLILPPGDEQTLESDLLARVQQNPGVQVAAPTLRLNTSLVGVIADTDAVWTAQGVQVGLDFEVQGIDPVLDPKVRVYFLVVGRMPTPDRYETVLSQKFAQDNKLEMGEFLEIITPNGSEKLKIVGLLADEGVAMTNFGAVAFVPLKIVQELFNLKNKLSEIAIQVAPGIGSNVEALAVLKNDLSEHLGRSAQVIYPAARGDLVPRMLSSYQLGLLYFSIIAIFTGAFLIYNTFSMTVVERTQEIGMLRAIGMSRSQVLSMVLAEAGIMALVGSGLGIAAGYILARSLIGLLGGFLTIQQGLLSIRMGDIVLSMGIGIIVTLMAALLPAWQAAVIPPVEALRVQARTGKAVSPAVWIIGLVLVPLGWFGIYRLEWPQVMRIPGGVASFFILQIGVVLTVPLLIGVLERLARLVSSAIYGKEGTLGSENVVRSVIRTTVTVASLLISLTMIIGVGSMAQVITRDVQNWIDNATGGDVLINTREPQSASFIGKLANIPGVSVVSPMHVMEVRVGRERLGMTSLGQPRKERILLIAIDPRLYRQIGDKEFVSRQGDAQENWEMLEQGSALFVSSVVAEEYNVNKGETLSLVTHRGEHAFRIAGVTTEFTSQGYVVIGTFNDLKRWFGKSGSNQFTIKTAPGYDPEKVAQEIKDRYQVRYNLTVQTTQTSRKSILNLLNQATQLFEVLSLVGVVIGSLGILNTMTMNVLERQREIGGLRSLGMLRGQVVKMVLAEALTLGTVGAIYGLTFGNAVSHIFLFSINSISSYELNYIFTLRPYIISLFIALGISQIAATSPALHAARVNIIEALKHE